MSDLSEMRAVPSELPQGLPLQRSGYQEMPASIRHAFVLFVFSFFISALAGCRTEKPTDRPNVVPTTGTVTLNGKPVSMAEVTFMNMEAQRTGFGMTDENGNFFLTTFENADGVVPGEQAVAIRRVDIIDKTPENAKASGGENGDGRRVEVKWIIPEKYSSFQKSGLTVSVREGQENHFRFELP
ncbi:carboxypeptidase-like regulatory domain-containing protein [Planctomicrobium sp. SH664]|uniref:carboxypeptidase-like regulatory domain-containing protein n=1 Tax=Planctomicrobium sp. SH664 TaxID=3448125 RepID=UPI003F5C4F8A